MSPSELNLEKLRISREEIDHVRLANFKTSAVIEPDVYGYTGYLSGHGYRFVLPEVDIKNRWYSKCNGTFKSGFLYSDELKILSRINHKNILPFIGFCDEKDVLFPHDVNGDDKVILVYKNDDIIGTLVNYLQDKDGLYDHSWDARLKICIGVADGLNFLHSGVEGVGRVIHQNVQSKNIILGSFLEPKITNFYLSVIVPENQLHAQVNFDVHPEDNPDPIYHENGLLDTITDVYSYGILMFEMLIGMVANEEKIIGDYKPQRLINIVRRCYDNRPELLIDPELKDRIDRRSFHMFIDIAYRCISFNLKDRPTMDEVVKTIKEALDIHKSRSGFLLVRRWILGFLEMGTDPCDRLTYYSTLGIVDVMYVLILRVRRL